MLKVGLSLFVMVNRAEDLSRSASNKVTMIDWHGTIYFYT